MTDRAPAELDLRPRQAAARRGRRGLAGMVVAGLVLVAGFVLWRGLSSATVYFYNADEAVEQRATLGDRRIRIQGTVVAGSVVSQPTGVTFEVTYNGVVARVDHTGAPPELFQENIPVVVEGRWEGEVFAGDDLLVKHDEVYVEDNGERLRDARTSGGDTTGKSESDSDGTAGNSGDGPADSDLGDGDNGIGAAGRGGGSGGDGGVGS